MGAKTTLDRDISWMYFNHRILQEAQRDNVPLLERLKFLGIYSNNLDEFFRVRVSTMKRIVEYDNEPQNRPASTIRELREITRLTKDYSQEFDPATKVGFSFRKKKSAAPRILCDGRSGRIRRAKGKSDVSIKAYFAVSVVVAGSVSGRFCWLFLKIVLLL